MAFFDPPGQTDPIQFLLNARFPMPHPRIVAAGVVTAKHFQEAKEQRAAYEIALRNLTPKQVGERVRQLQKQNAEVAAARAKAEEDARFFNRPGTEADFGYWGKMSYWTVDEAVAAAARALRLVTCWTTCLERCLAEG